MMGTPLFTTLLRPPPPRLPLAADDTEPCVGNVSRPFCDVKGFSVYSNSPPPKVTVPPLPLRRATSDDAAAPTEPVLPAAPTGTADTTSWP
jgi:hypothetical protein